jgi:hypothetical protein
MRLEDDNQPWSKKVSVGTMLASSGSASQVKRDVVERRGGWALKEKISMTSMGHLYRTKQH